MTYRDDHTAALARVEALERELAELRERTEISEAEAAAALRDRQALAGEIDTLRSRLHQQPPDAVMFEPQMSPPPRNQLSVAGALIWVVVLVAIIIGVVKGLANGG